MFLKILNYVQKERGQFSAENEPSFVTVKCCDGSMGIILGEIICKSSNWQHIQRLNITILGANWQLFKIWKDCQMFIFYFVYPKHQVWLICNEKEKKICCHFDDTIEVHFLLGNKLFWGLRSEWDILYLKQNGKFILKFFENSYVSKENGFNSIYQ